MRCKVGDMAIIIGCLPGREENLGAFVTVTALPPPLAGLDDEEAYWGFEKASRPLLLICEGTGERNYYTHCWPSEEDYAVLKDAHLQPIRGIKINEEEKAKEPQAA